MKTYVFLFLCAAFACAQEAVNYASVGGRVIDPSNLVVPGATVTARQVETNSISTTKTDDEGRFRFPYLRVGAYEIRVLMKGFSTYGRDLTLTVGAAVDLEAKLQISHAAE